MTIENAWERALKQTEVVRARINPLKSSESTHLPYVFLAESCVNRGDTVIRKGEVVVERPALILPQNLPQFQGFELEKDFPAGADFLNTFFLVRGIHFPSLKYQNKTASLDVLESGLKDAIAQQQHALQMQEDVNTGLFIGPEDCWQFSVIIFICHQVMRQADGDIKRLLDEYRKRDS